MSVSNYLVVTPHASQFPRPITFKKGVLLTVDEKYEERRAGRTGFFAVRQGRSRAGCR